MKKIVLATESRYKKSLFSRLKLDFISVAADINETPLLEETAAALAKRLATEKSEKIANSHEFSKSWVIGADQSAQNGNNLVFKPGSHDQAVIDLLSYSGKKLDFYTAACVISPEGVKAHFMDKTSVVFRELSTDEVDRYLHIDKPYDCAGAFKVESLGISLFQSITSVDPTALIGLPLIQLGSYLQSQGFDCYHNNSSN